MTTQKIKGNIQILDESIGRDEINIDTSGQALITKIIPGSGIELSSTGVDSGTGDVTISAVGFGGITVSEVDGSPIVTEVDSIVFSGVSITDLGDGEVLVTVSGGVVGMSTMFSAQYSRNLTMTGNIVLTDADEPIQYLDPNGSTRLVTLPTPASSNHAFYIKNAGSNSISVHGESGPLRWVQALDEGLFVSNGTSWSYIYGYTNFSEEDITIGDNTTGNVSTSAHGFMPKLPNDATKYFNGVGSYVVPNFTTEFGDGNDGDVTITGGTVTLSRNMVYNNLTITGTGILKPAGFIVRVKGTLTIQAGGIIEVNGGNGGNGTSGAPGTGGTAGAHPYDGASLPSGGNGGVGASASAAGTTNGLGGSTGAGQIPSYLAQLSMRSGVGGGGGGAHGTTGLNGGAADVVWATPQFLGGTAGGAATGTGSLRLGGGGGGAGGGAIEIWANTINNAGEIQAKGGNGGNGVQSGTTFSGNGSGGSGGMIVVYYRSTTGSGIGTLNVAAGSAGTGGNGGGAGTAGLAVSFQV